MSAHGEDLAAIAAGSVSLATAVRILCDRASARHDAIEGLAPAARSREAAAALRELLEAERFKRARHARRAAASLRYLESIAADLEAFGDPANPRGLHMRPRAISQAWAARLEDTAARAILAALAVAGELALAGLALEAPPTAR